MKSRIILIVGFGCLFVKGLLNAGPLHEAVVQANVNEVIRLLQAGADSNEKSSVVGHAPETGSALDFAVQAAHMTIFRDKDAAKEKRFVEIVKILLEKGALFDSNKFAFKYAILYQLTAIMSLFLDRGALAMRDQNGNTPLHTAAQMGRDKIVQLLLERGADAQAKNNNGKRPVDITTEVLKAIDRPSHELVRAHELLKNAS